MASANGQTPIWLINHPGGLANISDVADVDLNSRWAEQPHVHVRLDTAEVLLAGAFAGDLVLRLGLSQACIDKLIAGAVPSEWRPHLWMHWKYRGRVSGAGAEHVHAAFWATIETREHVADLLRAGKVRATAHSSRTVNSATLASLASGTAPAIVVALPGWQSQTLDRSRAHALLMAMMPELPDGAGSERLARREAVTYACLATISAQSVAGAIDVPGLGRGSAYTEVFLEFPTMTGAATVAELNAAARFKLSLITDSAHGIGRLLDEDTPRRVGAEHPPLDLRWHRQARMFTLLQLQKATLDRPAVAARAAQFDTIAFFIHLLRTGEERVSRMAERWRTGRAKARIDADGGRYAPRLGDIRLPLRLPLGPEGLEQARREVDERASFSATQWDQEQRDAALEEIDRRINDIIASRLGEGNVRHLPGEYAGLASELEQEASDTRARGRRRLDGAQRAFERAVLGPTGPLGWVAMAAGVTVLAMRQSIPAAAVKLARAKFDMHRAATIGAKVDEWAQRLAAVAGSAELPSGNPAMDLIDEIEHEVAPSGRYSRQANGNWKRLQRPAPNIRRLHCDPDGFEAFYRRERFLVERMEPGEARINSVRFRAAVAALGPEFLAVMGEGRRGFARLSRAAEEYFKRCYLDRWSRKHLIPDQDLDQVLDEMVARLQPGRFVERVSPGPSEFLYCELPDDCPDVEEIERRVKGRLGDVKFVRTTRSGESAVIIARVESGLALEDIERLRLNSDFRAAFLAEERAFHRGEALPVFASRWWEDLAARYDPELAAIIGSNGHRPGSQRRRAATLDAPPGNHPTNGHSSSSKSGGGALPARSGRASLSRGSQGNVRASDQRGNGYFRSGGHPQPRPPQQ